MGRFIALVVVLAVLWQLLSGYFDKPLLYIFGVSSVLFSAYLARRAGVLDEEGVPSSLFPGIIGYWFWLVFEIGKANLIVAREALALEPKLSPKMFLAPNPPRSNMGKVIFGNSITMTPGTVTVDLREDTVLIHGLTEELCDVKAIEEMGQRVAKIEGRAS